MSNTVLRSKANDIYTSSGNELTLFVNLEGVLTVLDNRGVQQPISDYIQSSPSFDQVEEFPTRADFPVAGELDIIYVALDTDIPYIWNDVTNDYDVLDSNTGIGGLGTATHLAVFTGPNTIANSKWTDNGTFTKYTNIFDQYVSFLSNADNMFRLDRGQSFMNFSLGNPANSSHTYINSSNTVGLKVISNGTTSFIYGVPNVSETEVLKIDHDIVTVNGLFKATIGTDDTADNYSNFQTTDYGFEFFGISGSDFDNFGNCSFTFNPEVGFRTFLENETYSSNFTQSQGFIESNVNTDDNSGYHLIKVTDTDSENSTEVRITSTDFLITATAYADGGFFTVRPNEGSAYIGDFNGNINNTYIFITDFAKIVEINAQNNISLNSTSVQINGREIVIAGADNPSSTPFTATDLNNAYGFATTGFRAYFKGMTGGPLVYEKTASGSWISMIAVNVV